MQTMKFTWLDQGEVLEGFQREQGLLLFRGRYFIGAQSMLKEVLLSEFHDTPSASHGGSKKMLVGLATLSYWKGMRRLVVDFIKRCLVCQQTKYSTHASGGLLQSLPTPTAMTPYQTLFGRVPPSIISYPPGSSKVAPVEVGLVERDVLLRQLRENLLALYRQITLAKRLSNKLSKRYHGPFEVLERVGKVAYLLKLPSTSKIRSVFHVSLLKLFTGSGVERISNLPEEEHEWHPLNQPLTTTYPSYHLKDKVNFEGEESVTPVL
nr:Ty3/gypsy retrotransposon protein [Tanacetum cinerariifolium]